MAIIIAALAVSAIAIIGLALRRYVATKVYAPDREIATDPSAVGLRFERVSLRTADGVTLAAWHVQTAHPQALVVLFHGNAGTIADRLPHAAAFASRSVDTFLFDYRGYGASEGRASEAGLYLDGAAAAVWASDAEVPVIFYGESVGAAIAIETALHHAPQLLVIQSAFTSLRELIAYGIPLGRFISPNTFRNGRKVPKLQVPVLVVHGSDDDMIPPSMGKSLFDAITGPKDRLVVDGAGHNDVFARAGDAITTKMLDFVAVLPK